MIAPTAPQLFDMPLHENEDGVLVVLEKTLSMLSFDIVRVFSVISKVPTKRGGHAHKECTQILQATNGTVVVECDDGHVVSNFILDKPNLFLYVPPGYWSEQQYTRENIVLNVFCDKFFDEEDYIRQYRDFQHLQKSAV